MQTVILAAGRGTRMRPLTDGTAKPMLPVADRPLVAHVADAAVRGGASELIFVVGYESEGVRAYFGDTYADVPVSYAEQADQRGTADAVGAASSFLEDDFFVVLNGDMVVEPTALDPLYEPRPTVAITEVSEPSAYGIVELTEDGHVQAIVEKPADPPSTLANAGAYVFPGSALDHVDALAESERGEFELTDVLSNVIQQRPVTPIELERWLDVGRPWDLLAANEWKLAEISHTVRGDVDKQSTLNGPVVVEQGATVRAGVTIDGPVLIRSGAEIGPNAFVRGPTLIDEGATVGHAVEVKRSLFFPGATVSHLAYVGDSVLGKHVNFGAGTTVANLRHDGKPVRTTVKGDRVSTDRRKYGVVAGPDVKTGIDTNLNAGVVLPSGSYTLPGETLLRQSDVRNDSG